MWGDHNATRLAYVNVLARALHIVSSQRACDSRNSTAWESPSDRGLGLACIVPPGILRDAGVLQVCRDQLVVGKICRLNGPDGNAAPTLDLTSKLGIVIEDRFSGSSRMADKPQQLGNPSFAGGRLTLTMACAPT